MHQENTIQEYLETGNSYSINFTTLHLAENYITLTFYCIQETHTYMEICKTTVFSADGIRLCSQHHICYTNLKILSSKMLKPSDMILTVFLYIHLQSEYDLLLNVINKCGSTLSMLTD
jgi:DNA-directed RNA polymerase subunit L